MSTAATYLPLPGQPAALLRRLAAIFYDSLLLIALEMIAAALWLPIFGDAPASEHSLYRVYQLFLLLVAFAFFAGFWIKGGQTLGMRAWRLRVCSRDGGALSLRQAAIRFAVAILSWLALGAGFLWSLVDPQRRTWHDIASDTVLVHEAKPSR
jgi:uncharacterized RDD family membrane protein YckC